LPPSDRIELVRDCFRAYETGDRDLLERVLADDLVFSAPPDVGIDRAAYFERCWPNAGRIEAFRFVRLVEAGDEVVATYEATRSDGTRFRNTEVFGFGPGGIRRVEVYFGWELE
jgi:ketosteroid isomerase-like protein